MLGFFTNLDELCFKVGLFIRVFLYELVPATLKALVNKLLSLLNLLIKILDGVVNVRSELRLPARPITMFAVIVAWTA